MTGMLSVKEPLAGTETGNPAESGASPKAAEVASCATGLPVRLERSRQLVTSTADPPLLLMTTVATADCSTLTEVGRTLIVADIAI